MSMYPIASFIQPVGGTTQIHSFNNIPQIFSHLRMYVLIRTAYNGSENFFLRFNAATYNFSGTGIVGDGSSVTGARYVTSNYMDLNQTSNAAKSASVFASLVVDIYDYSSSVKRKTVTCLGSYDNNGSGFSELKSGLLQTTSPITSISNIGGTAGATLEPGTSIQLYGMYGTEK